MTWLMCSVHLKIIKEHDAYFLSDTELAKVLPLSYLYNKGEADPVLRL